MEKSTMTIYLPSDSFKKAKIEAVKSGITFSEIVIQYVLFMIDNDYLDITKNSRANDVKAIVYLTPDIKRKIKLYAAEKAVTISDLVYQSIEKAPGDISFNYPDINLNQVKKQLKKNTTIKTSPISYTLTAENDIKIRRISAETGKTRKQIIMDAIEKAGDDISQIPKQDPKVVRSSMFLGKSEQKEFKSIIKRLKIKESELINRALALL